MIRNRLIIGEARFHRVPLVEERYEPYRQALGAFRAFDPRVSSPNGQAEVTPDERRWEDPKQCPAVPAHQLPLGTTYQGVIRFTGSAIDASDGERRREYTRQLSRSACRRSQRAWQAEHFRTYCREHIYCGRKGRQCVEKTEQGRGMMLIAAPDYTTHPITVLLRSVSPHRVALVQETFEASLTFDKPERSLEDKSFDSIPLGSVMFTEGIGVIALHRSNGKSLRLRMAASSGATRGNGRCSTCSLSLEKLSMLVMGAVSGNLFPYTLDGASSYSGACKVSSSNTVIGVNQ